MKVRLECTMRGELGEEGMEYWLTFLKSCSGCPQSVALGSQTLVKTNCLEVCQFKASGEQALNV